MRKKNIAGLFAFFFGVFGMHRFYLGQRFLGVVYFIAFIIGVVAAAETNMDFPIVVIPAIVSFIDAILLFSMPKAVFDKKYNKDLKATYQTAYDSSRRSTDFHRPKKRNPFKESGIEKFREYDFEGAIEDFQAALNEKYDDPASHFNLACCHSILEDSDPAFFHLNKAVEYGFIDFEKIYTHDALAFLRVQPLFIEFVKNGYRLPQALPEPNPDLLSSKPAPAAEVEQAAPKPDLLDQIIQLGDLRDKGILTEEEFLSQKQKILGS